MAEHGDEEPRADEMEQVQSPIKADDNLDLPPERVPTPPPSDLPKKRPRLDLNTEPRKRGKSVFGILVGTLNKARDEDVQRNKSEAVRRRMSIERKLLSKLAEEQDSVRRQDEAKKSRSLAGRKEDDLAIRDTVLRLSQRNKPYLSHFLTTSDPIPLVTSSSTPPSIPLPFSIAPPPPNQTALYYLPAILLPEQEAFLKQRQEAVLVQMEQEKQMWKEDRKKGMEEIDGLRLRAEDAEKGRAQEDLEMEQAVVDAPAHPAEEINEPTETPAPAKGYEDGDVGEETLEY